MLTSHQSKLVNSLALGMDNKEISEALDISVRTVKAHTSSIAKRLGVKTKREKIVAKCFALGLLDRSCRRRLPATLTAREKALAEVAIVGLTYREISEMHSISEFGIKNAMKEVFNKCGCWSHAELQGRYHEGL